MNTDLGSHFGMRKWTLNDGAQTWLHRFNTYSEQDIYASSTVLLDSGVNDMALAQPDGSDPGHLYVGGWAGSTNDFCRLQGWETSSECGRGIGCVVDSAFGHKCNGDVINIEKL